MGYVLDVAKGIELSVIVNGDTVTKKYELDPGDYNMMHSILYYFPKIHEKLLQGNVLQGKLNELLLSAAQPETDPAKTGTQIKAMREKAEKTCLEVIDACIEFIKGTLGENEYEELFAGQRVNMMRLFNLCAYIYEWANMERGEVLDKYLDGPKVPTNRKEKRAAKKAAKKNKRRAPYVSGDAS